MTTEILTPVFDDRTWAYSNVQKTEFLHATQYIPVGSDINNWKEMITSLSADHGMGLTVSKCLALMKQQVEWNVTNGILNWNILNESSDEVIYQWVLEKDFVRGDRFEVGRLLQTSRFLHVISYATRELSEQPRDVDRWIVRLRSASASRIPIEQLPQDSRFSADKRRNHDQARSMLDELPTDLTAAKIRIEISSRALDLVDYTVEPELWRGLRFIHGVSALRLGEDEPDIWIEPAIVSLRASLDNVTKASNPEQWIRTGLHLSRAFLKRIAGDRATNIKHAMFGCREALEVLDRAKLPKRWAAAMHLLGCCYAAGVIGDVRENLILSRRCFDVALEIRRLHQYPAEWAETMLAIGDALRTLGGDGAECRAAEQQLYSTVLDVITSESIFQTVPADIIQKLFSITLGRLSNTGPEFADSTEDNVVVDKLEMQTTAVLLRPFGVDITLPCRFSGSLKRSGDGDRLTLEAALHRAIGTHMPFVAVGGPHPAGAARVMSVGAGIHWKMLVSGNIDIAQWIFLVPANTAGIRWEIAEIRRAHALGKCILVMPPALPWLDSATLWHDAMEIMGAEGIKLPSFDKNGALMVLDANGKIQEKWSFESVWNDTLIDNLRSLLPA